MDAVGVCDRSAAADDVGGQRDEFGELGLQLRQQHCVEKPRGHRGGQRRRPLPAIEPQSLHDGIGGARVRAAVAATLCETAGLNVRLP